MNGDASPDPCGGDGADLDRIANERDTAGRDRVANDGVNHGHVIRRSLHAHIAIDRPRATPIPFAFDLELTARCNNDCRQCYVNLPAGDAAAKSHELTREEFRRIGREAASLGAIWCTLTGGEPLLRDDFVDIYQDLRREGLVLSIFTNACLVTEDHARLFREQPPRKVEVTVYGATREVYERVTRRPGTYDAFRRGLDRLVEAGVEVILKATICRSNRDGAAAIAAFCRERSRRVFRLDPFLYPRTDRDPIRNAEIAEERLTPGEIADLEREDVERSHAVRSLVESLGLPVSCHAGGFEPVPACGSAGSSVDLPPLFRCGAGKSSFAVSHDGQFRLCLPLIHAALVADLQSVPLSRAWQEIPPRALAMRLSESSAARVCVPCRLAGLCSGCPAMAYLEAGALDGVSERWCRISEARATAFAETDRD